MLQNDAPDSKSMPKNIDEAIASLSEADCLRLLKSAKYLSWPSKYTPEELLDQAIFKALDGARQYKPELNLMSFLFMIMRSLVSSDCKSQSRHPALSLDAKKPDRDESFVEDLQDPRPSPELIVESKENASFIRESILDLFKDDTVIQTVVEGIMEEMDPKEIRDLTGLDDKSYASTRRLIRRRIDKAFPGRWRDE